jgi:hypothetical protein
MAFVLDVESVLEVIELLDELLQPVIMVILKTDKNRKRDNFIVRN